MSFTVVADVCWLNNQENRLFTFDNDIFSIYDVFQKENKFFNTSLIYSNSVLSATSKQDHEYLRCFALDHSTENYIALGFNTGRLSIIKAVVDDTVKNLHTDEIRDVQRKSINYLSWHYHDNNKLCIAHERGRGMDYAVVVYDLKNSYKNIREIQNTLFEGNIPEKICGLSWFKDDMNTIVIGSSSCIRLADLRERNGIQTSTMTQSFLIGVCTEPYIGYKMACYSKNAVFIYDRRFISYPISEMSLDTDSLSINRLSWQPNHPFNLTCTMRETGTICNLMVSLKDYSNFSVFDKHNSTVENFKQMIDYLMDEYKYSIVYNSIPNYNKIYSFDWHSTHKDWLAVLCLSKTSAKVVEIIKLRHDVSCDISVNNEIVISNNNELNFIKKSSQIKKISKFLRFNTLDMFFKETDLAGIMKQRIINGYGYGNTSNALTTIIEKSRNVIENDPFANQDLKVCWHWVDRMYQLSETYNFYKSYYTNFPGIKHIIKDMKSISSTRQDEITYRNRVFMNEKREKILKICGWPAFEDYNACKIMLDEMMNYKTIQSKIRAAALALFLVQGTTCKYYLQDLCKFVSSEAFKENNSLEFVEKYIKMASLVSEILNKFNGIKVPDYETICKEISDSYLLAMVKFLARREGYNTIHNEIMALKNIKLEDKLAFAAIHMDDETLSIALDRLLLELETEKKPLSALVITGLDDHLDCHKMIHKYIDVTNDVQTATILLVIGNCFRKSKVLNDLSVACVKISDLLTKAFDAEPTLNARRQSLHCVQDYMELMNTWSFCIQKTFLASFLRQSINLNENETKPRSASVQTIIVCNFCGMPIYPTNVEKIEFLRLSNNSSTLLNFPRRGDKTRVMSCARCRKPLPKCVICRRHFGSQAEAISDGNKNYASSRSSIDHWFVWCCNCNHGGHLSHIRSWFYEYPICPASGCDCLCMDRDQQLRDELFT